MDGMYRVWDIQGSTVRESKDVKCDETIFPAKERIGSLHDRHKPEDGSYQEILITLFLFRLRTNTKNK